MEMELYHVHTSDNQDNKWIVNNTIKVTKDFDSKMFKRQQNFCQCIKDENGEIILMDEYMSNLLYEINDVRVLKSDNLEQVKQILNIVRQFMYNGDFFRMEMALENCRKDHFEELPSRLHSMYLCDKDGLEYWKDVITLSNPNKDISVYKVLVNGTVFKTNEDLLPYTIQTYSEAYNTSFSYWKPKFKNTKPETNEYLCQGNIKVLEKIK